MMLVGLRSVYLLCWDVEFVKFFFDGLDGDVWWYLVDAEKWSGVKFV